MGKRIAGTAFVKVDSKQYTLAGSITVSTDEAEREGLSGLSGVAGFKETPRVPFIEGEFFATDDLSLKAIEAITDSTVTAELANGKTYVLRNAWTAGARELDGAEGTLSIKFEGISGDEVK
ncbi:phage tail tube protein [uncultured Kiloniella sp.]|uniref:phage tail tube protein n=1 Tax=uncultured Kiloniella sp. TaxID=1133091 RepID=UPI00262EACE7|nr:phage tail tube protein [uncultured Kiloniella sp.]